MSAFEGISDANELAYNWKSDAMLSMIGGSKDFSKGKCSSWNYIYKSPLSMKLLYYNSTFSPTGQYCDAQYEEICISVFASGKSEVKYTHWQTYYQRADPNNLNEYISDLQEDLLELTIDSDEAYTIAISDDEVRDFTSKLYGESVSMQAQGDWESNGWSIWWEVCYGIDTELNNANVFVNGTTGVIEYKHIHFEGNNFFFICCICPVIGIILIILILFFVMKRRNNKKMQIQPPQQNDKQPK
jgi:hypothetical protein